MEENQKQDSQLKNQQILHGVKIGEATVIMTDNEFKTYEKLMEQEKDLKDLQKKAVENYSYYES